MNMFAPEVVHGGIRLSLTLWDVLPPMHSFSFLRWQKNWSLEILWAIANGPFANAFTLTNSATKQIGVKLLQKMRVPLLSAHPLDLNRRCKPTLLLLGNSREIRK